MNTQLAASTVAVHVIASVGEKVMSPRSRTMPFSVPSMSMSSPSFMMKRNAAGAAETPGATLTLVRLPCELFAAVTLTAYESGSVIVNYRNEAYTYEGQEIAARSYLILSGGAK